MEGIHQCSICVEDFMAPKILPCFHTFCQDCLSAYVKNALKNGKFNCPICRSVIEYPKNGVNGFQTNFYISKKPKPKNEFSPSLVEIQNGLCGKHEGETLGIYCEDCEVPCCRDCKIELHDGHMSIKLEEKASQLFDKAKELKFVIKAKMTSIQKRERDLNGELKTVVEEKGIVKDEIMKRKAKIEEHLINKVDATVSELCRVTKTASNHVEETLKKVRSVYEELHYANVELQQMLESPNSLALIQAISNIRKKLDLVEIDCIKVLPNANPLFPGLIFQASDVAIETATESAMGEVLFKKRPRIFQGHLNIVSEFHVDLKNSSRYYVKALLPVSQNDVWLAIRSKRASGKNTLMKKYRKNGNEILSYSLKGQVNSMSSFPDEIVAVTMPHENKICVIEDNDNVFELASVMHPVGIVCGKDELFVCSVASLTVKDAQPPSVNRVLILSREGVVKRTIEFFDGRSLFTFPINISMSYTGEVIVYDFPENKIVCLNRYGIPKYTYRGGDDMKIGNVSYDDAGYVLVETSKGVHVLDEELKHVQIFDVDFEANHVVTTAVGQNGHMYTITDSFKVSLWKYI